MRFFFSVVGRLLARLRHLHIVFRPQAVVGFVIGALLLGGLLFANAAWFSQPRATSPVTITIEEGSSGRQVSRVLDAQGLVWGFWYRVYARLDVNARNPKAGEYELRRGMSYQTIAAFLAGGPVRKELTIRTWEGETIDQNAERLWEVNGIPTSTYQLIVGASRNAAGFDRTLELDFPFLAEIPRGMSLEGYLFPDTYRVWKDSLPNDLIYKQLEELQAFMNEHAEAQKASGMTWHEILTFASIIQDEMNGAQEQRIAAGVFLNRMEYGIPFGSDATINYLTGSGRARSTYADLAIDSPYNTYKNVGLPPGPIGNPGESAILAVLNPADTPYFYFLHDAAGNVYWARTGAEHNANRARAFGE